MSTLSKLLQKLSGGSNNNTTSPSSSNSNNTNRNVNNTSTNNTSPPNNSASRSTTTKNASSSSPEHSDRRVPVVVSEQPAERNDGSTDPHSPAYIPEGTQIFSEKGFPKAPSTHSSGHMIPVNEPDDDTNFYDAGDAESGLPVTSDPYETSPINLSRHGEASGSFSGRPAAAPRGPRDERDPQLLSFTPPRRSSPDVLSRGRKDDGYRRWDSDSGDERRQVAAVATGFRAQRRFSTASSPTDQAAATRGTSGLGSTVGEGDEACEVLKQAAATEQAAPSNRQSLVLGTSCSPFPDPTSLRYRDFCKNIAALRESYGEVTSGSEEMARTAYLRRPLASFCSAAPNPLEGPPSTSPDALAECSSSSAVSTEGSQEDTRLCGGRRTKASYVYHQSHRQHASGPTPQRTPRTARSSVHDPFSEAGHLSPPTRDDDAGDDYKDIPEGWLATEGTALNTSFSLAPTNYLTPDDPDGNRGASGNASLSEETKEITITGIDVTCYHGHMYAVIGDSMGRVDLMEADEPRTVLPNAAALSVKVRPHRASADRSSHAPTRSPMSGLSPQIATSVRSGYSDISPSELPTSVICSSMSTARTSPAHHGEESSLGVDVINEYLGASAVTPSPPIAKSSIGRHASKLHRKTTHQAFVAEFDCRKSEALSPQVRSIKFLPVNRSPGVTSYLAANQRTIKLFRIRGESFQHLSNTNSRMVHIGRGSLHGAHTPVTGSRASLLDAFTPRQRVAKRIVMPTKAFTNAHLFDIQSMSLCADGETFMSMDDLQIFWWHLEASDTTKATCIDDIRPAANGNIERFFTTASFHPSHASLFLVGKSSGECEIGDLRHPMCRHPRKYPISLVAHPELHSAVSHPAHNDILSSVSSAAFLGRDFVVVRDYMSLKLWDMRYPAAPVAACPVMGHLTPCIAAHYSRDYIFDVFPIAVDEQSLSVVTGLYDDTVAVWRPGRFPVDDAEKAASGRRHGHDLTHTCDEVEFFSAGASAQTFPDTMSAACLKGPADEDEPPEGALDAPEEYYPCVTEAAHKKRVSSVAISPGGDRIAFTSNDSLYTFHRPS